MVFPLYAFFDCSNLFAFHIDSEGLCHKPLIFLAIS